MNEISGEPMAKVLEKLSTRLNKDFASVISKPSTRAESKEHDGGWQEQALQAIYATGVPRIRAQSADRTRRALHLADRLGRMWRHIRARPLVRVSED